MAEVNHEKYSPVLTQRVLLHLPTYYCTLTYIQAYPPVLNFTIKSFKHGDCVISHPKLTLLFRI